MSERPGAHAKAAAFHVVVSGRVQGVGFRAWTQWTARRLGVYGWVKNDWSGDVVIHAEGNASAVQAFLAALESGPSMARVERVRAEETAPKGYAGFEVEY